MRGHRLFSMQRAVRVADFGPRQNAYEIKCAAINCGAVDHVTNVRAAVSPETAQKRFERAGWTVGANAKGDYCPRCTKLGKPKPPTPSPSVKQDKPPMAVAITAPNPIIGSPPKASPPRQMSREDRRIIFAKLQEVYLDEKSGYGEGWGDQRVADDLGVPRAWVDTIREENFGPAKDNEDVRRLLAEVAPLKADLDRATAEIAAIRKALEQAEASVLRIGMIQQRIDRETGAIKKVVGA